MTDAELPLLRLQPPLPFDRIEAAHVRPAIDALLSAARAAIERIAEAPSDGAPRTYANTLRALDDATEPLSRAMEVIGHLESVATTEALRRAHDEVLPEVTAFFSSIPLHDGLHAALRAAWEHEGPSLPPTRRRHLRKTLDEFVRHGAELSAPHKARLRALDVEISALTTRYAHNVLDATNAFELVIEHEAELAGLPPSAIDAARASAAAHAKGSRTEGWRFTLQAPSYLALMTYLEHAGHREHVWRAFNTRACAEPWDNRPLLGEILRLRRDKARLLGFSCFADLVLEDRMATSGARAQAFVDDLRARARAAFTAENDALLEFRREREGPDAPPLRPWDVAYWSEQQRRARFELDEEALRPYFALPRVIAGMFELARRLYGVRIELAPDLPTWHERVDAYSLWAEDGTALGSFYVDAYPRPTKRDGAWMNGLVTGELVEGGGLTTPHVALVCANVTEPLGDAPALLTHREVETLFHEFGHLMHHMLSRVEVRGLGGTNVAWDFVELPSQIMENWCWERECLDLFARHWQTDAPIPDALWQRLSRARTYRAANAMMRQLGFAALDLWLHMEFDPEAEPDVMGRARAILDEHSAAPLPDDHGMIASFGHLFAHPVGYAAAYYSYKWAEVLDADAFTRFASEGLFDPTAGRAFRDEILARGDSRDPMELYVAFMGREPSVEPLLRRSGLL
ncbi:M3 family metallopeptidase [Paraliomyxa miuraensis]|uniref:M3 family metallopeptidase n=1 Tax=Paraliomyxa miuraensis TaxID=376150 RepID=UPI002253A4CC|nr:M3 family metallopeptidase [Paraliomyxa miuraensis]MCX4241024.1 M3 family metallopeptidase [Paraliomyxa miuraensis]